MGSYQWVTAKNVGSNPPRPPAQPFWWDAGGTGTQVLAVPAPTGYGNVLKQTRVWGYVGITDAGLAFRSFAPVSLGIHLLGDVTDVSGPLPNPRGTGVGGFQFSAALTASWQAIDVGGGNISGYYKHQTEGYVASKGQSGPKDYGAVTPVFNLAITTEQQLTFDPGAGAVGSWWAFYARCLWFVP